MAAGNHAFTPSGLTIDENAPEGTLIGTIEVYDPDGLADVQINGFINGVELERNTTGNAYLSWEGHRFDDFHTTLTLRTGPRPLDFETLTQNLHLSISDSEGTDDVHEPFAITVNNVDDDPSSNAAPFNLALSKAEVAENAAVGTVVGLLSASDEEGEAITWSLDTGSSARFEIVGNELRVKSALDYEAAASHAVRVVATDAAGNPATKEFTVAVGNVDEAPTGLTLSSPYKSASGGAITNVAVAENSAAGTLVGVLSATDPEKAALTYTLTGDANGLFTLDGTQLKLAKATGDFESASQTSYDVTFEVKDAAGNTSTKTVAVKLADAFDAPEGALTLDASGSEGVDFATVVADAFAGLTGGAFKFYGGTPDVFYGQPQNVSGKQIAFDYKENGAPASDRVVLEGTDLAYDYIHSGAAQGHGISGSLNSLTFGQWAEGRTTGTPGTGDSGLLKGLSEQLKISGFDLKAVTGSGHAAQVNLVYALYSAVQTGNAAAIADVMSHYEQNAIGSIGNDRFTGGAFADSFQGKGGADVFDGAGGRDTLVLSGDRAAYTVTTNADGSVTLSRL